MVITRGEMDMKTLIYGAGPLGSLYTYLFHKAGHNVTLLARNDHYKFLKEIGLNLVNEFTQEKYHENISVTDSLNKDDFYDLVVVLMRKNSIKNILPILGHNDNIKNMLFMGNNALGFDEYLKFLPIDKILFGFPGGGGSRINHVAHFIDSEKPNGKRMPVTIGEIDGTIRRRTKQIQHLFKSAGIPVNLVDDIGGWLKYHVAFINPVAGALLKAGDNYKLAQNREIIEIYIRSVKEGNKVLKALGYKKSYNPKFNLITIMPERLTVGILKKVFNTKFAEIAMMMHVNAARDEMKELGLEFKTLRNQADVETPNLDELISCIQ